MSIETVEELNRVGSARLLTIQTRFDCLLGRMRRLEASAPSTMRAQIHELWEELSRIRRDLADFDGTLPAPPEPLTRPAESMRNLTTANAGRHRAKQRDGQRHCPRHNDGDGVWMPVECFSIKNKATGALRSWCDQCYRSYLRERYVKTTATTVTVELQEDDFCVGHPCPVCSKAFQAGERVVGQELAHSECAP